MEPTNENKLLPHILREAAEAAKAEGIVEEDVLTVRTSEIAKDAQSNEPETEVGKMVREKAIKTMESGVESLYMDKPRFDWSGLRDSTTLVAMVEIMKEMGNYPNLIAKTKPSKEEEMKTMEAFEAFSLKIFDIMDSHNVRLSDYNFVFTAFSQIFSVIGQIAEQQIAGHRGEILSRIIGTRNPETNKFDQGSATYAQLKDIVERVRKETGGRNDDYFIIENPE